MKLSIDSDSCQGHGICHALAPHWFGYGDDGYATVLHDEVGPDDAPVIKQAMNACPERAIRLMADG